MTVNYYMIRNDDGIVRQGCVLSSPVRSVRSVEKIRTDLVENTAKSFYGKTFNKLRIAHDTLLLEELRL